MKKAFFCICENKDAVTAKLISAFVSATRLERFIYFLNSEFQASFHLLWLNSLVYVGHGLKPRRPVFSSRGSIMVKLELQGCTAFPFFLNHRLWVIVIT